MSWYRRVTSPIPELGAVPGDGFGIYGPAEGGPSLFLAHEISDGKIDVQELDFRRALPFALSGSCLPVVPKRQLVEAM